MAANDPKELEYEGYRRAARSATESAVVQLVALEGLPVRIAADLRLTAIDDYALSEAGGARFPWARICGQTRPFIRRFEVAIWLGDVLQGLCIGRASRGPDNVTIHFVERFDGYDDLRGYVAQIATDAADNYALVIGRRRVKLRNPVEGAIPLYRRLDFTLAESIRGSTYYERIVEP